MRINTSKKDAQKDWEKMLIALLSGQLSGDVIGIEASSVPSIHIWVNVSRKEEARKRIEYTSIQNNDLSPL